MITEVILFSAIWPSNVPAKESRRCALFLIRELFCHDNAEAAKPQTIKRSKLYGKYGVAKDNHMVGSLITLRELNVKPQIGRGWLVEAHPPRIFQPEVVTELKPSSPNTVNWPFQK